MSTTDVRELLAEWLAKAEDEGLRAELEALRDGDDEAAVRDAFFQELEFGTAGLRGIIGAGTNRMNVYTVGRATQGFADYLNARFERPSVAIARDSRNKGELFVKVAASVLAANGVTAHVFPAIEPTPVLSWAVRHLGCSGGICMTASHNPAAYNGYKAYGPDGCQITTQASKDISAAIARVDAFADVRTMPFEEAIASGLVRWIDDAVVDAYLDAVQAQAMPRPEVSAPLKVAYTPLHGTGLKCVTRILERIGVEVAQVVESQALPDGNFPTCPYPNPETREAMQEGIRFAESIDADILIATDPDADRMGVAARDEDGAYHLLTGNEIGVLLLDYVARCRQARGEDLSQAVAVTTIVSSTMVDAVAAEYGFEARRVLTGFKYIGELIGQLEAAGQEDRFIFGFEESYGYLSGPHVRDKDAVNASMLLCQAARYYKGKGMSLVQAMRALYEKHGYFLNRTVSLEYPGAEGAVRMSAIMAGLRAQMPSELAGLAVESALDYAPGVRGLPAADVVEFALAGGNKVIVRPSGTEPKIKLYLFAKGATQADATRLLDELELAGRQLLA